MNIEQKIKRLEQKKNKALGVVETLEDELRDKHKCSTVAKARAKIVKLSDSIEELIAEKRKLSAQFDKQWGHLLDDN